MRIGEREFDFLTHTYVMGIMNVTPDSFSDGGKWGDSKAAIRHVEDMIHEGADIIDVGGESTRPGYTGVSCEEELTRVIPMIRKIKLNFSIPVSIDTSKAKVARAAIEAGADFVNEVTGLFGDSDMASLIAEKKVPCCLMHNGLYIVKGNNCERRDIIKRLIQDFEMILEKADKAGIERNKIILDPGIGFGKTYEENMTILANLDRLSCLGMPLLLGTSRKSVIGNTLGLSIEDRLEGSLVTSAIAAMNNFAFVRVHDVKEHVRSIQMTEEISKWTI